MIPIPVFMTEYFKEIHNEQLWKISIQSTRKNQNKFLFPNNLIYYSHKKNINDLNQKYPSFGVIYNAKKITKKDKTKDIKLFIQIKIYTLIKKIIKQALFYFLLKTLDSYL